MPLQASKDWIKLASCNHLETCAYCKAELKRAVKKAKEEDQNHVIHLGIEEVQ